jgi:hypothetical protein
MRHTELRLRGRVAAGLLLVGSVFIAGCATTIPKDALVLTPDSFDLRQLQTRRIDGISETKLLAASVGVLQDLGFEIDESETKLGVIVASKDRSAVNPAAVAGAILLAALSGAAVPWDSTQKIRVSLVTHPALATDGAPLPDSQVIRITIQRIVWNTQGQVTHVDAIEEPQIYQEFYEKLSKSIFLEVHAI